MSKGSKCLHDQNWISLQYTTLEKKTPSLQSFALMMPNTSKSWKPQRIMESADKKDWTGTVQKVYFEILVNCHICSAHFVDKGCLYNRFSSRNWVGRFTNFCSIFLLFSHQISMLQSIITWSAFSTSASTMMERALDTDTWLPPTQREKISTDNQV